MYVRFGGTARMIDGPLTLIQLVGGPGHGARLFVEQATDRHEHWLPGGQMVAYGRRVPPDDRFGGAVVYAPIGMSDAIFALEYERVQLHPLCVRK